MLTVNRSGVGATPVSLYRVLSDWGEGSSDASGQEGRGTSAEPGDATWTYTFFDNTLWTTSGGDFIEGASATTNVSGTGPYTWSGFTLTRDVQQWLDEPSTNNGWILIGDETQRSTKRYGSREGVGGAILTISYTMDTGPEAWAGFPFAEDGRSVNTGAFLGWIDVGGEPWIWSYSLENYLYLPERSVTSAGAWVFVSKQ